MAPDVSLRRLVTASWPWRTHLLKTLVVVTCLFYIPPGIGAKEGSQYNNDTVVLNVTSTSHVPRNLDVAPTPTKVATSQPDSTRAITSTTTSHEDLVVKDITTSNLTASTSTTDVPDPGQGTGCDPICAADQFCIPIHKFLNSNDRTNNDTEGRCVSCQQICANPNLLSTCADKCNETHPFEQTPSGIAGNETTNVTSTRTLLIRTFNAHRRVILGVVGAIATVVFIIIGKIICSKFEKRLSKTPDDEYAYILEDAFSMATEENVWDARWTGGKEPEPGSHRGGGVAENGEIKSISEETSLRAGDHTRVTLHVPGSGPYGATESLIT